MKKIFIILGLIAAITATILSVTKFFNLAFTPLIIAFIIGLIIVFLSKKEQSKTKTIQYIFLLVIISLSITLYKDVTTIPETDNNLPMEDTEQLQEEEKENLDTTKDFLDVEGRDEKI